MAEIREDLAILTKHWRYLRLYDCSLHAERVLQIIHEDQLDLRVMLGAYLGAEVNNPGCPWGGIYSGEVLQASTQANEIELSKLVILADMYPDIVFSVAVGNEATVDWTDHLVPVDRMIAHVRRVKERIQQPVTFCENYDPWKDKLSVLVDEVDFISIHTYPVWEYKHIPEAFEHTKDNVHSVTSLYPGKSIVITEAGWAMHSNGRGIQPDNVSQHLQAIYYEDLMQWSRASGMLVFVLEAFDEPWKGSPDPLEPERHWGLFDVDRKPKQVMRELFAELVD